jgi:NitT/TauT family transport system substrate-binding protein
MSIARPLRILDRIESTSRRRFLAGGGALAGAALVDPRLSVAADGRLETTRIRLVHAPAICLAPQYLAEAFLRAEGFTQIEYIKNWTGWPSRSLDENRADFTQDAVPGLLTSVESNGASVALAGIHIGCFELFARDSIGSVRDLRGKTIAIPSRGSPDHMLMASMLAYIGIDPVKGVDWVMGPSGVDAMALYLDGKADAYLAFAPQGHELRAKRAGHLIVNTAVDRPWSQYYCCTVLGRREYMTRYPVATKRALRAFLKATDLCAQDPPRAARMLAERGFEPRYQVALDLLKELSYARWREGNPEDTVRFHALRLHESRMIRSTPQKIISRGTDWRFLNELKRELKA